MADRLKFTFVKSLLYFSLSSSFGKITSGLAFLYILKKLSPEEIGLVSIAAVFCTILSATSEIGFEAALVQGRDITRRQKNGVFWIGLGLAGTAYTAVFLAAPLIARFYREPDLEALVRVFSLVLFANALRIVPYSLLVRDLEFGKISVIDSVSMLISSVLMVYLAFRGMGPWSLILAELARAACVFLGAQIGSFFIPGIGFSLREIAPLLRFGFFATASRILYNLYTNIDYLVVGKFFGASAVGIYTLAYRLVFDTLKAGTGVINKVAFPTFSRLQTDLVRLRRYFFSIARMNLSVLSLFLVLTAVYSDWALRVFGYYKWMAAVPIIRIFCLVGLLRCVIPLIPQLLNALGRSKMNMVYSALCAVVMPPAFYLGAGISMFGVACTWMIVYPLAALLLLYFALKYLKLPPRNFAAEFLAPLKILLTAVPAVFLVRVGCEKLEFIPGVPRLLTAVLLSLALWFLGVFVFDKQISKELLSGIRGKSG